MARLIFVVGIFFFFVLDVCVVPGLLLCERSRFMS